MSRHRRTEHHRHIHHHRNKRLELFDLVIGMIKIWFIFGVLIPMLLSMISGEHPKATPSISMKSQMQNGAVATVSLP